jgi:hypothetical protein
MAGRTLFDPLVTNPVDILTHEITDRLESQGVLTKSNGQVYTDQDMFFLNAWNLLEITIISTPSRASFGVSAPMVANGRFSSDGVNSDTWHPSISYFKTSHEEGSEAYTRAVITYDQQFFEKTAANICVAGRIYIEPRVQRVGNTQGFLRRFERWGQKEGKPFIRLGAHEITVDDIVQSSHQQVDMHVRTYNFGDYRFRELEEENYENIYKRGKFAVSFHMTPRNSITITSSLDRGCPAEAWFHLTQRMLIYGLSAWQLDLPQKERKPSCSAHNQ